MPQTPENVLRFWFGDSHDDAETSRTQSSLWWKKQPETDADIRRRFEHSLQEAAAGKLDSWTQTPEGRLALLLVLDQFPRNMYRDSPQAFAYDAQAQRVCLAGLEAGDDQALRPLQRVFFYLPLEHAEDRALQARSVALFSALAAHSDALKGYVDFAVRHQVIIDRFGRFPHRNAILGRETTPEEAAFLTQPGSSF